MRKALVLLGFLALSAHVVYAIGTIKEVRLANGYDDVNRISAAVVDATDVKPLHFTMRSAYDRGAKIVRRGATNMFTRGPEYNLDKAVDLGTLFADALRTEANAMGFKVATSADAAWAVDGTLRDVYLESKQIPYGATLFYGYMDVELQIRDGGGSPQMRRMRFHNYYGGYNAGMGRKDEAEEAIAHLLVEGAQEAVTRLSRDLFKARPHADIASLIGKLQGPSSAVRSTDLYRVGLSGSPDTAQPLLSALPKETEENRRSLIIDALARLGDPAAVPVLTSRYALEDEDCRWYTLKAMDYIGTPEAIAFVKEHGVKDKDGGPRRLAGRIVKGS
jgi:hypothetical protein